MSLQDFASPSATVRAMTRRPATVPCPSGVKTVRLKHWCFLASIMGLAVARGAHAGSLRLSSRSADVPDKEKQTLQEVLIRADEEHAMASDAEIEAQAMARGVVASQKELLADEAREQAELDFEKARPVATVGKAALQEARTWAFMAEKSAIHARLVAAEIRRVPAEEAEKVMNFTLTRIRDAAYSAAELSVASPETDAQRAQKVAIAVAEAVEPVHLNLLRAQKAAAEDIQKAKNAATAVQTLAAQAHGMAAQAQAMQTAGAGLRAQLLMTQAHAKMGEAMTMKSWVEKLWGQANTINAGLGNWQVREAQAAAAAAGAANAVAIEQRPFPTQLNPDGTPMGPTPNPGQQFVAR